MKKIGFYIFAMVMSSALFFSCEDPYAAQVVAAPGSYDQLALTDTSFIATATTAAIALTEATATDSTALLTVNTALSLDSGATIVYDLQISNKADFSAAYHRIIKKQLVAGSKVKLLNSDLNLIVDSMNSTVATTLYSRLVATVSKSGTSLLQKSYSAASGTAASFSVTPYSLLKAFGINTPRMWYLIGGAIGDGSWNNSPAGLGVSLYPLSVITGNVYNKTGDGTFTYTGYFESSKGFKLIRDLGNWDEQWGISGSTYVHNNGSSSDIKVAADGWYTITLNSIKNTLTVTAVSAPSATTYSSIGLIGEFNGWGGDVALTKAASTNSHIWYTTTTFTSSFTPPVGSGGCKFRANGGWETSWGGGTFPCGLGTNGGTNVPFLSGTYVAIFNDLDGAFCFVKK